jgi:hypothetical protein
MSRDEFILKYLDETTGLLLAAYAAVSATHMREDKAWAETGRTFIFQQRRAKTLLGKIYDELRPAQPLPTGAKKP